MRELLLKHRVVAPGQGEQITATAKREQSAEAHAEHEEYGNGGAGQAAGRIRALLAQRLLDVEKFAEYAARLVELGLAASGGDHVGDVLMLTLQVDHLLRVGVPAR